MSIVNRFHLSILFRLFQVYGFDAIPVVSHFWKRLIAAIACVLYVSGSDRFDRVFLVHWHLCRASKQMVLDCRLFLCPRINPSAVTQSAYWPNASCDWSRHRHSCKIIADLCVFGNALVYSMLGSWLWLPCRKQSSFVLPFILLKLGHCLTHLLCGMRFMFHRLLWDWITKSQQGYPFLANTLVFFKNWSIF